MDDTVTLKNESNVAITVNLDHEIYCRFRNACGCSRGTVTTRVRPKDGSPGGSQEHKRRHPAVVDLMPGATSAPLHPAAIRLPQVVTGVARGGISVSRPATVPVAEAPPEAKPTTRRRDVSESPTSTGG